MKGERPAAWKGHQPNMLRGGSWLHQPRDCTVYRALYNCTPYTNITIGFRVLLEIDEQE